MTHKSFFVGQGLVACLALATFTCVCAAQTSATNLTKRATVTMGDPLPSKAPNKGAALPVAWRWSQEAFGVPRENPFVDGDTLYVVSGERVYALDRITGNQKWRFPNVLEQPTSKKAKTATPQPNPNGFPGGNGFPGAGSFPGGAGNFPSGGFPGSNPTAPAQNDGGRNNNGSPSKSGYDFRFCPVASADSVFAASQNRVLVCLNKEDGGLKWSHVALRPYTGQPVLFDKFVALALNDGTIETLDAASGEPINSEPYRYPDGISGQMLSWQRYLIFWDQQNDLVCFDPGTQKVIWQRQFGYHDPTSTPVISGDILYTTSGDYVEGLNLVNGGVRFEQSIGGTVRFGPAVSTTTIGAITTEGDVTFMDLRGHVLNRVPISLGSPPSAPPSAVGDNFLFPTASGSVNLVDPNSGKILWGYVIPPMTSEYQKGKDGKYITTVPAASKAIMAGGTLVLYAADGSLLAFDKQLGVDLTPPEIKQVWPALGEQVSGQAPLEIIFRIRDEVSGVDPDSISVTLDGKKIPAKLEPTGYVIMKVSESGDIRPLRDGRRTLVVTAGDWMGNLGSKTFLLSIDNTLPPLVRKGSGENTGGGGPGGGGGGGGGRGGG